MATDTGRISGEREAGDVALIERILVDDDSAAGELLIRRYHQPMLRLADLYASTELTAADLANASLLAAITGLDGHDPGESFRVWLFRALIHQVRGHPAGGGHDIPFATVSRLVDDPYPGAVDPMRLRPPSDPVAPLHWAQLPPRWDQAMAGLSGTDHRRLIDSAIVALSPAQREVITLRDILEWTPCETASALGITEAKQRALLHRARTLVRSRLEEHFTA